MRVVRHGVRVIGEGVDVAVGDGLVTWAGLDTLLSVVEVLGELLIIGISGIGSGRTADG